ncbi:MAG: MaoC/PaaZ C-terminal domain-containing protein [Phenylobacterium sp.]
MNAETPVATAALENHTFDELKVGDEAKITRTVTSDDVQLFAAVTGDVNPAHLDPDYAATDLFHHVIVHGLWGAGLFSALLGVQLPGPGTIYLDQSLKFLRPVDIGDTITATVEVKEKRPEHQIVVFACRCVNQLGVCVIEGEAVVKAPTAKVVRPRPPLAEGAARAPRPLSRPTGTGQGRRTRREGACTSLRSGGGRRRG